MHKTYFNWSSGKDASLALYYLSKQKNISVKKLLTSINSHHNRVSMHGLRRVLLEQQAQSIGLPLQTIELPEQPDMETYNKIMLTTVTQLKSEGYSCCGFGDIFLEDLKTYRESQLKPFDINCKFPLWKKDTKVLLNEFLELGFKAVIICINAELLDTSFLGRVIDTKFIDDLPQNVDPCGENGEYHTFCFDGPIFNHPIPFTIGEHVYREYKNPGQDDTIHQKSHMGFWFCDLLPSSL